MEKVCIAEYFYKQLKMIFFCATNLLHITSNPYFGKGLYEISNDGYLVIFSTYEKGRLCLLQDGVTMHYLFCSFSYAPAIYHSFHFADEKAPGELITLRALKCLIGKALVEILCYKLINRISG